MKHIAIYFFLFVIGWLLFGCSNEESSTTVPDVIISGTVTDQSGQPLSDAHIHLIYLFEMSPSAGIAQTAGSRREPASIYQDADEEYDLGDLGSPYPTFDVAGGGPAHRLSGIAWLGTNVNGETEPNIPDDDAFDDGIRILDLLLEVPCPTVVLQTQITGGPNYFQQPLYLNMWIDGNEDGDFDDDSLCSGIESSEWWMQNRQVSPSILLDTLLMPAVNMTMESRRAVRVRLSRSTLGRSGYTGVDDEGGEVEDHWLGLESEAPVDLVSFTGEPGSANCRLDWQTASETGNSDFIIGRSTTVQGPFLRVGTVGGQGTTSDTTDYQYIDCGVINDVSYYYQLTAVDIGGVYVDLEPVVSLTPSEDYPATSPSQLFPVYPNPGQEVHIPFRVECSRQIHVVVESADFESLDTLWVGVPQEPEYEVSWNGGHHANGLFVARVMTSQNDFGEQYFFLNRDDPTTLSSMDPLYITGSSGSFQIVMTRAKWGMSFAGRDDENRPIDAALATQVVVVATRQGYAAASDTVAVSPNASAQVTLVMEPQ